MRSRANDQERILKTSLVQNGGLLKHGDRTCGKEELLPRVVRGGRLCTMGVEEVRKREVSIELSYAKEDLQNTRGLAIVKLRLFFPLVRH